MYHDILFRTFSLSLSLASAQYKSALTILSSRLADHQHRNWFYSCWLYHCCSFDVCAQAELYAAMMWRSYFYAREIPECRCKQSGRQSALIAPRVISLFHFKVFIIAPIFIQPIIFVFCCCFFCSLMPVTQQWNRGFIWNTPAPVICQIHTKYLQFSSIIHFYGDFSAHNVHVNTDRRKKNKK